MKYRREIDGLRAVAVVPVVLFHAGFSSFSGGYVGVDVFFVISGYLITTILLSELHAGKFSIVKFYERRARRLLPALFLVMASCLPFAWLWLLPEDMVDIGQSLMSVVGFVSNLLFWREETGYFNTAAELKPLLHTWSLAVEEQFYLLFPLALMLLWRLQHTGLWVLLALVSAISLAIAEWGAYNQPAAAWFLLPTRAWELGIGALAAMHLRNKPLNPQARGGVNQLMSLVGIGMIAWAIFFFDDNTPFPGIWGLLPVAGTALVILFATPATLGGKMLGMPALVGIGLISYSAYLWHQPLLAFARQRNIVELELPMVWGLIVATFGLAWLSWRYVETPFRHASIVSRKQVFSFSAAGMVAFFVVGTTGWAMNGFEGRVRGKVAEELVKASAETKGQYECWSMTDQTKRADCIIGVDGHNADYEFALVGDSHISTLYPALDAFAKGRQETGIDLTLGSCPVFLQRYPQGTKNHKQCRSLQLYFSEIMSSDVLPSKIIVGGRWIEWFERVDSREAKELSADIIRSLRKILESGRAVILLYPVPEMHFNVPKLLLKYLHNQGNISSGAGSVHYSDFNMRAKAAKSVLDAIGDHQNLTRVYPENLLCDTILKDRCAAHIDGKPLYSDDNHLRKFGVELILENILEHL